ncbi:ComEC/Rec2 family competence protein [Bailinhaonella thermotolerans]|uniref:ComEC/Rec2 family competence protein n=2 Tax=Bailinhaonella thermotolerans TaxID=1070861 RepID=A0A3A4AL37_9ACTN|nr:ComEC/Rec2 family competence protein [Bailinhaonella thermotolerans]
MPRPGSGRGTAPPEKNRAPGKDTVPRAERPSQGRGADSRADGGLVREGAFTCRLLLPALGAWLTSLVLLRASPVVAWLVLAAAASAVAVLAAPPLLARAPGRIGRGRALRRRAEGEGRAGWRNVGVGVLVCVAGAAGAVGFRLEAVRGGPVAELAGREAVAEAEVVLTEDMRVRAGRGGAVPGEPVLGRGRVERVWARDGAVRVRAPVLLLADGRRWLGLLPSQRVRVTARFAAAREGELLAAVLLVRGPPEVAGEPSGLQRWAGGLRAGLREASTTLPPAQGGLLPALVIGDTARMDEQVRADFRDAGLGHLTAVSGANLAIIAGAAVALARWAGLPLVARGGFAALAMIAFAVVARPSPSVLRALVMGLIAAVALATGRSRHAFTALTVASLGLVLFDPELAASYGFALSVCATGGILLLAPRWRDRFARRVPFPLAEALAVTAAAQAACTPVLVLMTGGLGPASIPANLLAGPAVAPATVLGFLVALVAPFQMEVARLLAHLAGAPVWWIVTVARIAAALPGATLPWPAGWPGLALLLVAGFAAWVVVRRHALRRTVAVVVACALPALLAVRCAAAPWPPPGWLLVACDVGQGDALVANAGDGRAVVVDTGPDPVAVDRCLRRLGVRAIPLLVLTHPHLDHTAGLSGALRERPAGAVLLSPYGRDGSRPDGEGPFGVDVRHIPRGVPLWHARAGTRWRFGALEITVVAAAETLTGGDDAVNNASVVLLARWPQATVLLPGDIEPEAQRDLVRRGVPRADVLKVPHHGSAKQDPAFLQATGARAALISAGSGNSYGHPAPGTLRRLAALGMRTHRTDQEGDLALTTTRPGTLLITSSQVRRGCPGTRSRGRGGGRRRGGGAW